MKALSLFSGIGGIDLGLENVGIDTAAFSEFDPKIAGQKRGRQYAREVMTARFPTAADVGDITTLTFARNRAGVPGILRPTMSEADPLTVLSYDVLYKGAVDIIAGGFPCQDISTAGKGAGIKEGTRSGLWFAFARAIEGLRPRGVLIENVAALATKGLDIVLADLARIGYDAEWDVISAAGVGAPHLRDRLFIIAWPSGQGTHRPWPTPPPIFGHWLAEPNVPRLVNEDVAARVAKLRCLGNAVVPQVAAHVAGLLVQRLTGEPTKQFREEGDLRRRDGSRNLWVADERYGERAPGPVIAADGTTKLPRAGRMTNAVIVERKRSCEQKHAKKVALENMAPTLRRRPDDHPELPREGLVPTPNASVANDGEGADTWIERKIHHATKADNPTRASMPLAIYAQVKAAPEEQRLLPTPCADDGRRDPANAEYHERRLAAGRQISLGGYVTLEDARLEAERLVPTPTAKDADSSRNASAIRSEGAQFKPGTTLTDYVDPTNGGRLLPTPRACAGLRSSGMNRTEMMDALDGTVGDAKMLPTPAARDWKDNGSPAEYERKSPCITPTVIELDTGVKQRGKLNPEWVTWLMGFPPGWLELDE